VLTAPVHQLRPSPYVVVVGNEKAGQRVATIDLDGRQRSLTHYIENRRGWARRSQARLELPTHFCIARVEGAIVAENEAAECSDFQRAVAAAQDRHDFVVIDTPPHDSYLMRLAHSITDTLVTPLNDSFLDLDVLATLDPVTLTVTGIGHYGELVREIRRHRRPVDGTLIDWVVVRNRISPQRSSTAHVLCGCLQELALNAGFRAATGFQERAIYRDLFPRGLTALDQLWETMPDTDGEEASRLLARGEVQGLLEALKLPINDRARRHAALRAEWFASRDRPLDTDILAGP
jgi:chromosome partitioning protein